MSVCIKRGFLFTLLGLAASTSLWSCGPGGKAGLNSHSQVNARTTHAKVERELEQVKAPEPTPVPTPVFSLTVPSGRATAGAYHTCSLTTDDAAECWGLNDHGQLGTGDVERRFVPTAISGLTSGVAAITAGLHHSCAAMKDGRVKCWGANIFGQLGDGTVAESLTPKDVAAFTHPVSDIRAGNAHTCALDDQGSVFCWGSNRDGQLGTGDNKDANLPTPVVGLGEPIGQLSAGRNHTCALTRTGKAFCWGKNTLGQLGNGSTVDANSPVLIVSAERLLTVAAGFVHTCTLSESGQVSCFGDNTCGELGTGTNAGSLNPIAIADATKYDVATIAVGGAHTCFSVKTGEVFCFGSNQNGNLGNGEQQDATLPQKLSALASGALGLIGGDLHSCAFTPKDGKIWCWGGNERGQVGDGSKKNVLKPILLGLHK